MLAVTLSLAGFVQAAGALFLASCSQVFPVDFMVLQSWESSGHTDIINSPLEGKGFPFEWDLAISCI